MNGIRTTRGRFSQWKDLYFPKGCGSYEINFRPINRNKFPKSETKILQTIENSLSNEQEIVDSEIAETNNHERFSDHRTGRALGDNTQNSFSNNQFNRGLKQFNSGGVGKSSVGGQYDPNLYDKPFRRDNTGK